MSLPDLAPRPAPAARPTAPSAAGGVRRVALAACPTAPMPDWRLGGTGAALGAAAQALAARGVDVDVVAPAGSQVDGANVIGIAGRLSTARFGPGADEPQPDDVLIALWRTLGAAQHRYDAILNFASDWLPYHLAGLFETPVLNRVSLPRSHLGIAAWVEDRAARAPLTVRFLSRAHGADFAVAAPEVIRAHGLKAEDFPFTPAPVPGQVAFVGRVCPEKGLRPALAAAAAAGRRLAVAGHVQDEPYFRECAAAFRGVLDYRGMLDGAGVAALLAQSEALLMPSCWNEPFGRVAIEAMACGTPVLALAGGGPAEIIGETSGGMILDDLDPATWARAIAAASQMDRAQCRRAVLAAYGLERLADDLLAWIAQARAAPMIGRPILAVEAPGATERGHGRRAP